MGLFRWLLQWVVPPVSISPHNPTSSHHPPLPPSDVPWPRLYAGTLRTRRRDRPLERSDESRLTRRGLPVWHTEADLARALGLTVEQLRFYATHRAACRVCHYVTFAIPKRGAGLRSIHAPKARLKLLQRALLPRLIDRLPLSDFAHGFRRGRNVRSNAEAHVGRAVVLRMDLQDFFPTVHFGRVRGLFLSLGYGFVVAATLAALVTEAIRQPVEVDGVIYHLPVGPRHCVQGAPTSPGICNALALRLDRRLAGLARALGFRYTRYADDLTFSTDDVGKVGLLHRKATAIIEAEGLRVNPKKTRVVRKGARQRVTGVTVNEVAGLSRRERRRLRALLHQLGRQQAEGEVDARRLAEAKGRLAYLHMLNPAQAEAVRRRAGFAL